MRSAVLARMEATLEAGTECGYEDFHALGMSDGEEPEFFEPADDWTAEERAMFHYVRGNYCLYRLSDSYLNRGISDFAEAFPSLSGDAARATRAFARILRQSAFASSSLSQMFGRTETMLDKLDWMRANAPREDVEELDLSIVEMLTRIVRESPFNERDTVVRAYETLQPALIRLLATPPARQRAMPYALLGFWLGIAELWKDDDLGAVQRLTGETTRAQMRRFAYEKACDLEDGSFYRVGRSTPIEERKQQALKRHISNLRAAHEAIARG